MTVLAFPVLSAVKQSADGSSCCTVKKQRRMLVIDFGTPSSGSGCSKGLAGRDWKMVEKRALSAWTALAQ